VSSNWNSFGNQSLNGLNYRAPDGFTDLAWDYVFPDAQQFPSGTIIVPAGATAQFNQFTDQGSLYILYGIEMPAPAVNGSDYGYELTLQIYLDEEQMFNDSLNNVAAFGNGSAPFPVFPVRMIRPGTNVRVVLANASGTDYYNCSVVLRGLRRYAAPPQRQAS
jgi:hypothetical protein